MYNESVATSNEVSVCNTYTATKNEKIVVMQHAEFYYTGASGSYDYVPLTVTVNDVEQELNYILNYPKYRNMACTEISLQAGDVVTATSTVVTTSGKYKKFVSVIIVHS